MKRLILILLVLFTCASCSAFAEGNSTVDDRMDALQAQIERLLAQIDALDAQEAAQQAEDPRPAGDDLELRVSVGDDQLGRIFVRSAEATDQVAAIHAAEDSEKLSPSAGHTLLDFKLVYTPFRISHEIAQVKKLKKFASAFSCRLFIDGQSDFEGKLFVQAAANEVHWESSYHDDMPCTTPNACRYLVSVEGTDERMQDGGKSRYYLFDYVVEVPETVLESADAIYLQISLGESDFVYRMQ